MNNLLHHLLEINLVREVDIIIYYNNHCTQNQEYHNLDDCLSALIDVKYIDEDEIREEVIKYYNQHFANSPHHAKQLVNQILQSEADLYTLNV